MSLHIRVDDFPGTKPDEFSKHNLENFKLFDDVLAKHGIDTYVLGVIPKYTVVNELRWMGENPRIKLAVHGVLHDERFANEFREWQTCADIKKMLYDARIHFEDYSGKSVTSYIPPHNVVDKKTCVALKAAGFTDVFGGPGMIHRSVIDVMQEGLKLCFSLFPFEYGRTDELLQCGSVDFIKQEKDLRDIWLCLHWPWEFNIGLEHLDTYLEALNG